jgi:hypothetical protein
VVSGREFAKPGGPSEHRAVGRNAVVATDAQQRAPVLQLVQDLGGIPLRERVGFCARRIFWFPESETGPTSLSKLTNIADNRRAPHEREGDDHDCRKF